MDSEGGGLQMKLAVGQEPETSCWRGLYHQDVLAGAPPSGEGGEFRLLQGL